jgi:hypothetical protein
MAHPDDMQLLPRNGQPFEPQPNYRIIDLPFCLAGAFYPASPRTIITGA